MGRDEYRVTLFKKKLRSILGADWVRFYNSKGMCHLVIHRNEFAEDGIKGVPPILARARIDYKINRIPLGIWADLPEVERPIFSISIPIDQAALPERARTRKS